MNHFVQTVLFFLGGGTIFEFEQKASPMPKALIVDNIRTKKGQPVHSALGVVEKRVVQMY